ncbi:Protein of uncharacterised function (DUF1104) [Campylobacter sputorum subsp. bubulus]|uniref:Protein of uncharacterized function (DUF1104) n=1 Tax=Campylobacter sputorum subsp. sputorum TaxID=32024 RepID=A0A381DLR5_9BACT|nr:DUF1104 domain-containing protein [Campylobacter sputorum]ASM34754.1 hypothetical protein CSPUT_0503 [Campylobacter sputorum aubsp. sputorum RM3237]KAB0581690.1 DUF1104 domain-containing protein [Campylobacter sputorum subsp. sputorum]QEL04945.1 hypothetical protein CSPT_0503 [Campylobacter sputorum subsp. sputorum]SUX10042.1 Protein of uncharacterised function (DUF1104) [Campylobacter sputorum subsp. bubulus]SUX11431.1 Protein of uncharacterised function (DUF1104) [Campylobacter sputorum s
MKKVLFTSLVLATMLFGADLSDKMGSEIISGINSSDTSSLADAAFEIRKRANNNYNEISKMCQSFHNIMKAEMMSKNPADRQAFRDDFHKKLSERINTLSSSQKADFDFAICKKYISNAGMSKGGCGMMNGSGMGKGMKNGSGMSKDMMDNHMQHNH